ncbi:MAG: hypothetical protein M1819_003349 [Sarea resinae]|nr:MAG: hypothetical protein M1819_003349 [Sarea resinae]
MSRTALSKADEIKDEQKIKHEEQTAVDGHAVQGRLNLMDLGGDDHGWKIPADENEYNRPQDDTPPPKAPAGIAECLEIYQEEVGAPRAGRRQDDEQDHDTQDHDTQDHDTQGHGRHEDRLRSEKMLDSLDDERKCGRDKQAEKHNTQAQPDHRETDAGYAQAWYWEWAYDGDDDMMDEREDENENGEQQQQHRQAHDCSGSPKSNDNEESSTYLRQDEQRDDHPTAGVKRDREADDQANCIALGQRYKQLVQYDKLRQAQQAIQQAARQLNNRYSHLWGNRQITLLRPQPTAAQIYQRNIAAVRYLYQQGTSIDCRLPQDGLNNAIALLVCCIMLRGKVVVSGFDRDLRTGERFAEILAYWGVRCQYVNALWAAKMPSRFFQTNDIAILLSNPGEEHVMHRLGSIVAFHGFPMIVLTFHLPPQDCPVVCCHKDTIILPLPRPWLWVPRHRPAESDPIFGAALYLAGVLGERTMNMLTSAGSYVEDPLLGEVALRDPSSEEAPVHWLPLNGDVSGKGQFREGGARRTPVKATAVTANALGEIPLELTPFQQAALEEDQLHRVQVMRTILADACSIWMPFREALVRSHEIARWRASLEENPLEQTPLEQDLSKETPLNPPILELDSLEEATLEEDLSQSSPQEQSPTDQVLLKDIWSKEQPCEEGLITEAAISQASLTRTPSLEGSMESSALWEALLMTPPPETPRETPGSEAIQPGTVSYGQRLLKDLVLPLSSIQVVRPQPSCKLAPADIFDLVAGKHQTHGWLRTDGGKLISPRRIKENRWRSQAWKQNADNMDALIVHRRDLIGVDGLMTVSDFRHVVHFERKRSSPRQAGSKEVYRPGKYLRVVLLNDVSLGIPEIEAVGVSLGLLEIEAVMAAC